MKSSLLLSLFSAAVPLWAASAPAETSSRRAGDALPGRFIVQLVPGASSETVEAHRHQVRRLLRRKRGEDGGNAPAGIDRVFSFGDFHSYSASLDDLTAADVARLPDVLSVEPDVVISLEPSDPEPASDPEPSSDPEPASDDARRRRRSLAKQANAPWHLGDISHKTAGAADYVYNEKAGEGTTIYVVDSGIRASHVEFGDRVRFGINAFTGSTTPAAPALLDTSGHGTHVASCAAGKTYGVAKKAQLVDCKSFGGSSTSVVTILTAVNWAVNDIIARKAQKTSVLSMSLGTPMIVQSLDGALIEAYKQGIVAVVAAGNSDEPTMNVTPGHLKEVITIGMTEPNRNRVSRIKGIYGSNYGPELDLFAPGGDIVAAGHISDTALATKTGTSMATPIVSGVISYLRSIESGLDTPEQVRDRLIELSWKGVVKDPKGSPNRLLYNGSGR